VLIVDADYDRRHLSNFSIWLITPIKFT